MKKSILDVLWVEREESLLGFHIRGHAGDWAQGENIVCAAVSAIAQCTAMGIIDVAGVRPALYMEEGDMQLLLPDNMTAEQAKDASTLLRSMEIGLRSIAADNQDIIAIRRENTV